MIISIIALISIILFALGIRIIRPTHVGLIETFGKYSKTATPGFNWIIPIVQNMYYVNMTEQMVDTASQMVITKDNLNASVDATVYYKITNAKHSVYNVSNHKIQLITLAQTTLRAVIGSMTFSNANENRSKLNEEVEKVLDKETSTYGVNVLRVEIQRIEAPDDVQNAMNEVVKAERLRIASIEKANANEIEADGFKRAEIKKAEGIKQRQILEAEGRAESIKLVNESAEKYFIGNAKELKKIESTVEAISKNSKIVIPDGKSLVNVIGNLSGIES